MTENIEEKVKQPQEPWKEMFVYWEGDGEDSYPMVNESPQSALECDGSDEKVLAVYKLDRIVKAKRTVTIRETKVKKLK